MLARHAGPAALLQGLAESLGLGPGLGNPDGGSGGLLLFAQPSVQQGLRSPLTVLGCLVNASLLPLLFKSILCPCVYHPWSKSRFSYKACKPPLSLVNEANSWDFRFMDVPLKFLRECPFSILCEGERQQWGRGRRMLLLDPASDSLSFLPLWISQEESQH